MPACGSAMKTVTEVVEASASVIVDPERLDIVIPDRFQDAARGTEHPLARYTA